jgi:hypothetical protein
MPVAITFSPVLLGQIAFFGLLFCFALYGVFLAYHWYTFGTDNHTSTIALATYLLGGAVLFIILAMSLNALG